MHIYITRHGKAHAESDSGRDDDRALRPRGERQATYLGDEIKQRDHVPTVVYSSGLLRSEQTADIVARILGAERAREHVLGLGHRASDVIEALQLIRKKDKSAKVMLVGHNPQLESLIGVLINGPAGPAYRMRTGTCAVLRVKSDELVGGTMLVDTLRYPD